MNDLLQLGFRLSEHTALSWAGYLEDINYIRSRKKMWLIIIDFLSANQIFFGIIIMKIR